MTHTPLISLCVNLVYNKMDLLKAKPTHKPMSPGMRRRCEEGRRAAEKAAPSQSEWPLDNLGRSSRPQFIDQER